MPPLGTSVGLGRAYVNPGKLGGSKPGTNLGLLPLTGVSFFYSLEWFIGVITSSTFNFSSFLGSYFSSFVTS